MGLRMRYRLRADGEPYGEFPRFPEARAAAVEIAEVCERHATVHGLVDPSGEQLLVKVLPSGRELWSTGASPWWRSDPA